TEQGDDRAFQGKRRKQLAGRRQRALPARKAASVDAGKLRKRQARRIAKHATANQDAIAGYLQDLALSVSQRTLTKATTKDIGLDSDGMLTPAESDKLLALLQSLWTGALDDASSDASDDTGVDISFDVSNPKVKDTLAKLTTRVKDIDDTTRDAIRAAVNTANDEGWSIQQLAASIKEDPTFNTARATTIARTESATAYNTGSVLAYRESGVVSQVQVMDGDDDEDCAAANGATWDLDEAEANPTEHPNCTRAFSPIVDVAADQEAA
ncbi:MAG: phage minor head protein, partial [Chloroflexota bacterium]